MNLIAQLVYRLRQAPLIALRAEAALAELTQAVADLRFVRNGLVESQTMAPPTFVYVLPPTSPMLAQWARVGKSARQTLSFTPHRPLEAGTWIVAVGPAGVRTVAVGNTVQSSMSDYQGQVCQTKDACELGMLLRVELEAP